MVEEDDKWWLALKELGEQNHKERVAKTPERIEYAIKRFNKEGIKWTLKNKSIGHFHIFDEYGNLFQFWAGTGKIWFDRKTKDARHFNTFYEDFRGIDACIKIVKYIKKDENGHRINAKKRRV